MEQLHRRSDGSSVTVSGLQAVILHPAKKIDHDGRQVTAFTYHPPASLTSVTIAWDNPKNIAVIEQGSAAFLLNRKWARNLNDEELTWWNDQVEGVKAEPTPIQDLANKADEEKKTPETAKQAEPAKAAEPVKSVPPVAQPAKPVAAVKPVAPVSTKTAEEKAALLAKAEQEAAQQNK